MTSWCPLDVLLISSQYPNFFIISHCICFFVEVLPLVVLLTLVLVVRPDFLNALSLRYRLFKCPLDILLMASWYPNFFIISHCIRLLVEVLPLVVVTLVLVVRPSFSNAKLGRSFTYRMVFCLVCHQNFHHHHYCNYHRQGKLSSSSSNTV